MCWNVARVGGVSIYTGASTQTGPASHWPGITPCESLVENATLFQETKWHADYRLQKWQCLLHISGSSVPANNMQSAYILLMPYFVVWSKLLLMILRWLKRFCCECILDTIYAFFACNFCIWNYEDGLPCRYCKAAIFVVTKNWKSSSDLCCTQISSFGSERGWLNKIQILILQFLIRMTLESVCIYRDLWEIQIHTYIQLFTDNYLASRC